MSIRAESVGPTLALAQPRNRLAQVLAVGAREAPVSTMQPPINDGNVPMDTVPDGASRVEVEVALLVLGASNEAELKHIFFWELQHWAGSVEAAGLANSNAGYGMYNFSACNPQSSLEYTLEFSYVGNMSLHSQVTLKFPVENSVMFRSIFEPPPPPVRPMATQLMEAMAANFATALEQKSDGRLRLGEPLRWAFV